MRVNVFACECLCVSERVHVFVRLHANVGACLCMLLCARVREEKRDGELPCFTVSDNPCSV